MAESARRGRGGGGAAENAATGDEERRRQNEADAAGDNDDRVQMATHFDVRRLEENFRVCGDAREDEGEENNL